MKLLRDKIKRDTYMCSKLCNMIARGDLRDDHPQQRKSGQWDNETRDNFIITVIKNEDFDPIKICEQITDRGIILWLIDGLQRSTTIENFKSGKFSLGRNIDPYLVEYQELAKDDNGKNIKDEDGDDIYNTVTYDLRGKSYVDLPEKIKEDFDNCPVMVVKHLDCDDKEVGRHIVRYNSGRKMVTAQKITTYMYNNAKYLKSLSDHSFFNDCANFPASADKNGTVNKVISESIMGINFFDSWKTNAKKVGQFLNDNATKEMFDKFKSYLDRLLHITTPQNGKLFSAKNAFIWFMLFDKFNTYGLEDKIFSEFLSDFNNIMKNEKVKVSHSYELKKNSGEYTDVLSFSELDGSKSTKDKGIVTDKLHILETMLINYLHINNMEEMNSIKENTSDEKKTLTSNDEMSVLDFVKDYIKPDVIEEDIDCYYDMLNDYKIDRHSPLLEWQNEPSLIGIIAYSSEHELDLDNWIVKFFDQNNTYIQNQEKNYLHMRKDLEDYIKRKGVAA